MATNKTVRVGAATVGLDLLSPEALSSETGIPQRTLAQWRHLGKGPAFTKLGKHIRYRRHDVVAWLDSNRHERRHVA